MRKNIGVNACKYVFIHRRIYESYTLYTVTYAMATYYLYVIAAFGVPGNVASIFTIITLPTVSSSKVSDCKLEVIRIFLSLDRVQVFRMHGRLAGMCNGGQSALPWILSS